MQLLVETAHSGRPYVTAGIMLVYKCVGPNQEVCSQIQPDDIIVFREYRVPVFAVEFVLKHGYVYLVVAQKVLALQAGLLIREMYGQQLPIEAAS